MRARELKMLEKAYAAEVNGALGNGIQIMQTRGTDTADQLVNEGYLRRVKETHFGVTIEGYLLTDLGRLIYCMSAGDAG